MSTLADVVETGRWFRHGLPEADHVTVNRVQRVSRGVSRETWIVDATVAGPREPVQESFVVRRDLPSGSVIPVPLREEFDVYRLLGPSGVPVAKALWFEDDPRWQPDGRPAYVRTLVRGDWRLPVLASNDPADDAARVAASKEHLDKLALVHTADWRGLGFGHLYRAPEAPADCAIAVLDDIAERLAEIQFEPSPAVAEAMSQLRQTAPIDAPCVALCKGTNGHGEEVWSGGRIVAMSDWELCRLSDPAYDFAQLQEMVPEIVRDGRRIWGWPEALEYYTRRCGIPITQHRLDWYRACYGLIQFLYAHHSARLVRQGARNIRLVWNASEIQYRSHVKLGTAFGFAPAGRVSR